jgi:hypothetical protein
MHLLFSPNSTLAVKDTVTPQLIGIFDILIDLCIVKEGRSSGSVESCASWDIAP